MAVLVCIGIYKCMSKEPQIYVIRDNLIDEIASLQTQIGTLELALAAMPPIAMSGPGTSFNENTSEQLKNLNDIVGNKIEQLERVNKMIIAMYPYELYLKIV